MIISTQGPVSSTIPRLWKMILEKEIPLIIMLCNIYEECNRVSKKNILILIKKKCEKYWPEEGKDLNYENENITVKLKKEEFILEDSLILREISVSTEHKQHLITQLHVINWPDYKIPEKEIGYKTIEILITFIDIFKEKCKNKPTIVHCR